MLNKSDTKNIIKVGLILFAITAVSALILAVVNSVTSPVISKNNEIKQNEAMKKVLCEASEFKPVDDISAVSELSEKITGVYEAIDSESNTFGYAILVSPNGYGGEISMVVGVDNTLTVTGLDIISQSETASLGARCTEDDFKNQFAGKKENITVSKNGAKDNEIDAISSATITSKAVTRGVNTAIEAAEIIMGGAANE